MKRFYKVICELEIKNFFRLKLPSIHLMIDIFVYE